jgi:hypothetical protein
MKIRINFSFLNNFLEKATKFAEKLEKEDRVS